MYVISNCYNRRESMCYCTVIIADNVCDSALFQSHMIIPVLLFSYNRRECM